MMPYTYPSDYKGGDMIIDSVAAFDPPPGWEPSCTYCGIDYPDDQLTETAENDLACDYCLEALEL